MHKVDWSDYLSFEFLFAISALKPGQSVIELECNEARQKYIGGCLTPATFYTILTPA